MVLAWQFMVSALNGQPEFPLEFYVSSVSAAGVKCINSAASLLVADKVSNLKDGVEMAADSIDSGSAADTLEKLVAASNG